MASDRHEEIVDELRKVASEIRAQNIPGWGNLCEDAADLIARLRARAPEGYTQVPTAALKWLNGEGPDDHGCHFGDDCYGDLSKRPFWWRSVFNRMLSASPEPPATAGWQDISSAPKDGRDLLLWGACERDGRSYAADANVGWWDSENGGWQLRDATIYVEPTHWAQIPPKPGADVRLSGALSATPAHAGEA